MVQNYILLLLLVFTNSWSFKNGVFKQSRLKAFDLFKSSEEFDAPTIFRQLGDLQTSEVPDLDKQKRDREFNVNMGRAMEALRRELPMAFHVSNLDYSIFSDSITVCSGNAMNKMVLPKSVYTAFVKSLRVAATLSFTQPCMNVRKIEYVEDCRTIQCLVDVVLPDTVRIEGASTWEGMFYFGLDSSGMIETHIFDKKIINQDKNSLLNPAEYPWIKQAVAPWQQTPQGIPVPQYAIEQGTLSVEASQNEENKSIEGPEAL